MKYVLEVHGYGEHGSEGKLASWTADSPFGSIAVGDTLDPSSWYSPLHDCVFHVVSVEHQIYQIDTDAGVETVHSIWLSCKRKTQH